MTTDSRIAETLADPRWFPLHFDGASGSYRFAFIPAEVHRELAFLREFKPKASETRVLPRSAVENAAFESGPLHFILHSGLGGSTLIARAVGQPGVAVPLQEPPILTDLILHGRGRSPAEMDTLLAEVARLLARPFSSGEAVVCKMSGIGNGVAQAMARSREDSQLLCLENALEHLLAAFASRGVGGRMAGRQLAIGLRNSRLFAFELSDAQLLDCTDFQMAALGWLSIQKMMIAAAQALGPTRVASVTAGQLKRETAATVESIASHFRLSLDVEQLASGVLSRDAKSGDPFDAEDRAERLADSVEVHRSEIEPVVDWARKIAETNGIPWELPYPLIERAA